MGVNEYGSKAPQTVPSLWWWEGPGSKKIKTWLAYHYGSGFDFFHKEWWRRGPVPAAHDVWYNPPSGVETFDNSPEGIEKAGIFTNRKLDSLKKDNYPFRSLAISLTNMWRCDNDPPARQISEFVQSWNSLGKKPELVFSTPSQFFKSLEAEATAEIKTMCGDWSDWWADGLASMPAQIAVVQDSKRLNEDLEKAAEILNTDFPALNKKLEQLSHQLVYAQEHTFDAYNSVAYPYNDLCMANQHHRYGIMYEVQERSKNLKAEIIRNSKVYRPFSETRFIEVLNPGETIRSGWISISGNALRIDVNAARDIKTGEIYPFEEKRGYDWSEPFESANPVLEFPDNVWGEVVTEYCIFLKNIQPGERRWFELIKTSESAKREPSLLTFSDENTQKPLGNLIIKSTGEKLFDESGQSYPGQLIIEKTNGFKSRFNIENRKHEFLDFLYSSPELVKTETLDGNYSTRKIFTFKTDIAKAIVQEFELPCGLARLDIKTTIWLNEQINPIAMYMAFPFSKQKDVPRYLSYGHPTRAGYDQMPGSCGEYAVIQQGVWWENNQHNLILHTPCNPLMVFDKLATRSLKPVFVPESSQVFSMIFNNYWVTNFPILRPAKLVLRHSIEITDTHVPAIPGAGYDLWAYPVKI